MARLLALILLAISCATGQSSSGVPPLTFITQPNGLASVQFQGTEFNFVNYFGATLVPYAKLAGNPTGYGPTCSRSVTATSVSQNCTFGRGTTFSLAVTYSTPDPYTLNASITATDTDPATSIGLLDITTLGLSVPGFTPATSRNQAVDASNPIAYVNFGSGQAAIWNASPDPAGPLGTTDITLSPNCSGVTCSTHIYINNLAPGQTKTASFDLRFTADTTVIPASLAPEAFSAYAAAYPSIVTWPDRRPFVAWFIADHGKVSATNPRGYLQDPTLNVSDSNNFAARVLGTADKIIHDIQNSRVQPQGITIWDLEGQEFVQPTTYIGDPRALSFGYAPEMNAVADQLFAKFQAAGLKVGLTLRPQQLFWVSQLPATCAYDPAGDYNEYDVVAAAGQGQKFYKCNPDGMSFTLLPNANGYQTSYHSTDPASVVALLTAKVAYAYNRWHTTFYYVDSTVWPGGSPLESDIFRQLQTAFPDCLFAPEESVFSTASVAMPYAAPAAGNPTITSLSVRSAYPTGNTAQYMANCSGTCWDKNVAVYGTGQRIGDMALYTVPSQLGTPQQTRIETMILAARAASSLVSVTDTSTSTVYSYAGAADSIYTYPLKMRVYFADADADLATSTTYCESGQLQGESTCSLNLDGLVRAQIQYYDFTNTFVLAAAPQPR